MRHKIFPNPLVLLIFSILLLQSEIVQSQKGEVVNQDSINTVKEALKLINTPEPQFNASKPTPMHSDQLADLGFEQVYKYDTYKFPLRDGGYLFARKFVNESDKTIILLHGVASNSYTYNKMSGLLREATDAEIFALDLRGHGQSSGTPGDVDYIDQYTDDVADVIKNVKQDNPDNKIILAGHSMGGGIALRYAMRKELPEVDAYLLFAPNLGHNAPTMRKSPQGNSNSGEPFLKVHLSRIVGLYMLNSIGRHEYDSLNVLFFNLPDEIFPDKYTYRSNLSMAPEDYKEGLRSVDKPLLVVAGSEDEAFVAKEYKPAVKEYSDGQVLVVEGATHNGIRHDRNALEKVKEWLRENQLMTK